VAKKGFGVAAGSGKLPGADDDLVALLVGLDYLGDLGDRGGLVEIGEEADLALGFFHTCGDGLGFTEVEIFDQGPLGFGFDPTGDEGSGLVGGAVVDNDNFPGVFLLT